MNKKYTSKNPILEYDPCDEPYDGDYVLWGEFTTALSVLIKDRFADHCVKVTREVTDWSGKTFGGSKYADDIHHAEDLIDCIFPRGLGESHMRVYTYPRGLAFRVTHHDNPVNGDWYFVVRVKQSTVDRYKD